jgi:molybdenum cofactor cytidylyltransferase
MDFLDREAPLGEVLSIAHDERVNTWTSAAIIVVAIAAESPLGDGVYAQSLGTSNVLGCTLGAALESRLETVIVCRRDLGQQARQWLPASRVVEVVPTRPDRAWGEAVAAGVARCHQARRWIILPAEMPQVQPQTLRSLDRALGEYTMVRATHHGRPGLPLGFSAGLYSELQMLHSRQDLERLASRYACAGVEVRDPGVLFDVRSSADLDAARALWPLALDASPTSDSAAARAG